MADLNLVEIGYKLGVFFIPFLFALTFHEFCHGLAAKKLGDNTAEVMGRLTLNPTSHADVLGTYVLPISALLFGMPFFGWAKPVPVDARNLKNPRTDMFWIALAGPVSNLFLAAVGSVLLAVVLAMGGTARGALIEMGRMFILINLFLAFFNLIPLHPLDGGKVFARFLPAQWNHWLEANQGMLFMALIGLFLIGGFQFLAYPVYVVQYFLVNFSVSLSQFL